MKPNDLIERIRATTRARIFRQVARWFNRRAGSVHPITPEELIADIAKKAKLNVLILPANILDPMPTVRLVYLIAERAGLCVTLSCHKKDMVEILKRKINYARWN